MDYYVKVEIELDGKKKIETFSSVSIAQRHNWHHTFEFSLPLDDIEGQDKTSFDQTKDFVGKGVKIAISSADGSDTFNQFNGIITDINIARHSGTGATVVFMGYSPTILLEDGENTRSYASKSISQIVAEVTNGYPSSLSVKASPSPDTKFDYLVQYRETNYAFLTRLADETGKWFYYDGKDVQFGKLMAGSKVTLKLGNDLETFDLGLHVKPLKFTDSAWDYVNNQLIKVPSSSIKVSGLDTLGNDMLSKSDSLFAKDLNALPYQKVKNQSELKDFSTSKKSAVATNLTSLTGISINPRLKIGTKIDVSSNDLDKESTSYGSFIVTNVTHHIQSHGVYEAKFEAVSANITVPAPNPHALHPISDSQPAVVVDNNDPDGYGRITVKFAWQPDVVTPWLRIVNHHAGKSKGFQFIPEKDDEVLVAFENSNPSRPYVVGALYNGKFAHKDRNDPDNYIKTIRTVSGNEIKFYDKGGKEEILIQNSNGQNFMSLSLDNGGKITIQGKNKMELLAKDILISADNTLTMKSDQTSVQGKSKFEVTTEQDGSIKASDLKIETQMSFSMKAGTQAQLQATAGITVDGGPQTTVKSSAMLELNGGGMATLKGGMVMIN